ncbi:MAG: RsmE family RNA methyltransferase [bacterium]
MVIFVENQEFLKLSQGEKLLEIDEDLIHYFKNVLRLKKNEHIIINNKNNTINNYEYFESRFLGFQNKNIVLNIIQKLSKRQNFPLIDIFIVPTKSRYFNTLIENLTQLPINKIYLIKSKFMAVNFEQLTNKPEKIKKIIYWNSIYVKKHYLVGLEIINKSISKLLENNNSLNDNSLNDNFTNIYDKIVVFDHLVERRLSGDLFEDKVSRIGVMIGPEGGWAREEINNLPPKVTVCKFRNIDTALKSELAAPVGLSQILALLNLNSF